MPEEVRLALPLNSGQTTDVAYSVGPQGVSIWLRTPNGDGHTFRRVSGPEPSIGVGESLTFYTPGTEPEWVKTSAQHLLAELEEKHE